MRLRNAPKGESLAPIELLGHIKVMENNHIVYLTHTYFANRLKELKPIDLEDILFGQVSRLSGVNPSKRY